MKPYIYFWTELVEILLVIQLSDLLLCNLVVPLNSVNVQIYDKLLLKIEKLYQYDHDNICRM